MSDSGWWVSFKDWAFNISIRKKIMGIAFGLLVLMGMGMLFAMRMSLTALLSEAAVSMPPAATAYALNRITWRVSLMIVVIALVGVGVAYVLTTLVTRPIRELVGVARSVGQGDFQRKAHIRTNDEIGHFGAAFNAMIDRLQAAQEELQHKEQMRSLLLRKVISAQEEERQRIARDLHDQIGQSLTTILLGLKVIETSATTDAVRDHVGECRSFVAQAFEEVHGLALDLRPSVLDDLGLPAALRRYIDDFTLQFGIKVEYRVSGFAHEERLSPEVETTVYRIIQEMLRNVARHAGSVRASLFLQLNDMHVQAVVEDAGKGFDVKAMMYAQNGGRLGLFGMQERASLLGGTLTIESSPNTGTRVIVEIPLDTGVTDATDPDSDCG